jgi:hypothetical protein
MLKHAVVILAGLAIILTLGIWAFTGISKDHSEVVQIEMHPHSPQPRPGPYEFEFKRAEEIWDRDHIAYVPSHHHVRHAHKLTHDTVTACYDRDGKQITPIPKGCTDLFIERDK